MSDKTNKTTKTDSVGRRVQQIVIRFGGRYEF